MHGIFPKELFKQNHLEVPAVATLIWPSTLPLKPSLTVAFKKNGTISYVFQAARQMDGWKFGDFQPNFPSLEVLKFWFII